MKKIIALALLLSSVAFGQRIASNGNPPAGAIVGHGPAGNWLFGNTDSSGNLFTNGTGGSGAILASNGNPPQGAASGINPSGQFVYLNVDSSGNLFVNCTTGCSGGAVLPTAPAASYSLFSTGAGTTYTAQNAFRLINAPVNFTAQSANIAPSTVTTPTVTSYIRICANDTVTRAATTSSTLPVINVVYTDANDSNVKTAAINTGTPLSSNVVGASQGQCGGPFYVLSGTTISAQTVGYASVGATAMQYDILFTVESAN